MLRSWVLVAVPVAVWAAAPDFEKEIRPILTANCTPCHSDKLKTSGFSVASLETVVRGGNKFGQAVLAGDPAGSPLIRVLKGQLTPRMPFGKTLAEADVAAIEDWIHSLTPAQTAHLKREAWLWPFRKPALQTPPAVKAAAWLANPIDAFVLRRLEDKGLRPAPPASPRVLARRLYFDLLGMPPSPDELNAFLRDPSPGAYTRLVDRLLDDPRYGERWARHWLDLVRYGETSGLEGDGAIGNAWRYRDWVIDAFNADMPYDRFVIQQLAGGDEHSQTRNNYQPDIQGHIPVAFLRLAPWDRSNLVADEVRQNYLAEVTSATGSIFLGLTIGCARCHDHKYDPIPTRDFYRLEAFFNAIKVEDVNVPYRNKAFARYAEEKIKGYRAQLRDGPDKKELDALEKTLLDRLIAAKIEEARTRPPNAQDLRLELRRKDRKLFSEAEVRKHEDLLEDATRTGDLAEKKRLEACEVELLKRLATATDTVSRYKELTVEDLRAELGKRDQKLFTAEEVERHRELTGQMELLKRRIARLEPRTLSVVNVPGPPTGPGLPPTHVLIRGDYRQPGEAVLPGFPSAITGNSEPAVLETDRYRQFPTRGLRMTLARWIASPDNPLTARVMVNRIWQYHFGRGLVETASDFGRNGSRPTHPELLDWLARKFVEQGWSVKAMHRLILNSSTYRQASENAPESANTADPEDKLLWRFPRRRLEAEEVRDSVLWTSGRLNLARGGPSVFPPLPADLADFARYGRTGGDMWEPNENEMDNRRRSIYTFQRRSLPQPMMLAFDAPVFSESCERRSVTTTPLQALSMMNGDLVNEEAGHLAERVATEAGGDARARITRAFELVLNRAPEPEEVTRFEKVPLVSVCRVLLNSNEFLYVD